MSLYIPPTNNVTPIQKTASTPAQPSAQVIKGGGIHNNSLTPTAGQAKTQSNLTNTVTGAKLDNKIVGTNAGAQSVNNWVNGEKGMPTPTVAPLILSPSELVRRELIDDYNYNEFDKRVTESMNDYANKTQNIGNEVPKSVGNNGVPYEPNTNYETVIDRLINANPTLSEESAATLKNLLNARDAKIQADPSLAQYRNSPATTRARLALENFYRKNMVADAYNQQKKDYRKMLDYVDSDIEIMKEIAQRERDANIKRAETDALNQRRNLVAAAPIADLALQEQLSAMGLSMGDNNSSGYSETSRLQNQLATNNQVAQNYAQLEQSKTDYNNAYLDAISEAYRSGLAQKMDIQKLIAEVGPEAAMAILEVEKQKSIDEKDWANYYQDVLDQQDDSKLGWATLEHNKENDEFYRNLESDKVKRDISNDDINTALAVWEAVGTLPAEYAKILNIPAGTQYYPYVMKANTGSTGVIKEFERTGNLDDEGDNGEITLNDVLALNMGPANPNQKIPEAPGIFELEKWKNSWK